MWKSPSKLSNPSCFTDRKTGAQRLAPPCSPEVRQGVESCAQLLILGTGFKRELVCPQTTCKWKRRMGSGSDALVFPLPLASCFMTLAMLRQVLPRLLPVWSESYLRAGRVPPCSACSQPSAGKGQEPTCSAFVI